MTNNKKSAFVIFGTIFPVNDVARYKPDVIIAPSLLQQEIESRKITFIDINDYIGLPSIYEASTFTDELSHVVLPNGERVTKSFFYEGYEIWWMHYNDFFYYFALPFSQYRKLLEHLREYGEVSLHNAPSGVLFRFFLESFGCKVRVLSISKKERRLPLGILLQIILTLLSLPIFIFRKYRLMIFTGDKFEKNTDHDFRMRYIYEELRKRKRPFVEVIRSLESAKTVLSHFFFRKRPVVYSEGVKFVGRFFAVLLGSSRKSAKQFSYNLRNKDEGGYDNFKMRVSTYYLLSVHSDIWSIRIMKALFRLMGIRAAFFSAAMERNYHSVLATKLLGIPTVGILHGVASKDYNVYDFVPSYDGEKCISVDKYGVWSDWWKSYYETYSKVYTKDQLFVSGLMRPFERKIDKPVKNRVRADGPVRVLFISEQLAVPSEVLPYFEALLVNPDIKLMFSSRPYRDGFRDWLEKNRPDILKHPNLLFAERGLQSAIEESDVVVGSHSTAVLEALVQYKVPIFFQSRKWGDYYSIKDYDTSHTFFAETPVEFVTKIKNSITVSVDTLADLRARYFGDPNKNGSAWVIDELEKELASRL